ncbi:MAG TPA: hypothetical protein GXX28_00040 [Firmicutes bacterium]|nr:hypothetical protein [Bacillota bacterium]
MVTALVAAPLAGALVLWAMPASWRRWSRVVAAGAAGLSLALAIYLCLAYDQRAGGVQFLARGRWLPALGAAYLVGADGLSLPLVLLTASLLFAGVLLPGWPAEGGSGFPALLLLQAAGVLGALVSFDLLLFLFFAGLAILPVHLLSAGKEVCGTSGRRPVDRLACQGAPHLLAGLAVIAYGFLLLYFQTGMYTFDLLSITKLGFDPAVQARLFPLLALGFALWLPAVPFHRWFPEVYAAAPGPAGLLQAGTVTKLGAYGMMRMALALFPEGARSWAPFLAAWSAVHLLYGAYLALGEPDPERAVGCWSLSQAGLLFLGIAALNGAGLAGAAFQMVSHGLALGLLATATDRRLAVGPVRARTWGSWVVALAAWGFPGFSPFVAQRLILTGAFRRFPVAAGLGATALFLAGLRLVGLAKDKAAAPNASASPPGSLAFLLFGAALAAFGLWPGPLLGLIDSGLGPLLARVGGPP